MQLFHLIAKRRKRPPNLPISAFIHGHLKPKSVSFAQPRQSQSRNAILKLHAKIRNLLLMQRFQLAIQLHMVNLRLRKFRMRHPKRKIPIVRKQNQARRIFIKPPHRLQFSIFLRQQLINRRRLPLSLSRTNIADRLIHHNIFIIMTKGNFFITESHSRGRQNPRSEHSRLVVHKNFRRRNQIICLATGNPQPLGKEFIEPERLGLLGLLAGLVELVGHLNLLED